MGDFKAKNGFARVLNLGDSHIPPASLQIFMLAMRMIKMMIEVIWILFNRKGKNNAFLIVFMVCTFSFVKDGNA